MSRKSNDNFHRKAYYLGVWRAANLQTSAAPCEVFAGPERPLPIVSAVGSDCQRALASHPLSFVEKVELSVERDVAIVILMLVEEG